MTAELVMNLAIGIIFPILGGTAAIRGYRRIRRKKESVGFQNNGVDFYLKELTSSPKIVIAGAPAPIRVPYG